MNDKIFIDDSIDRDFHICRHGKNGESIKIATLVDHNCSECREYATAIVHAYNEKNSNKNA